MKNQTQEAVFKLTKGRDNETESDIDADKMRAPRLQRVEQRPRLRRAVGAAVIALGDGCGRG
ncbi:uncharacterized protein DS421_17g597130 [Arachis hypogaea]|nr:uncharacterized protein DS421_17g597130 [Arachis hypogaea]